MLLNSGVWQVCRIEHSSSMCKKGASGKLALPGNPSTLCCRQLRQKLTATNSAIFVWQIIEQLREVPTNFDNCRQVPDKNLKILAAAPSGQKKQPKDKVLWQDIPVTSGTHASGYPRPRPWGLGCPRQSLHVRRLSLLFLAGMPRDLDRDAPG